MSKAPKAAAVSEKPATFEESLARLESIVGAMESDTLPLETLLQRFEEGSKLARLCQERLDEAELKIQQVEKTAAGAKVRPVEADDAD